MGPPASNWSVQLLYIRRLYSRLFPHLEQLHWIAISSEVFPNRSLIILICNQNTHFKFGVLCHLGGVFSVEATLPRLKETRWNSYATPRTAPKILVDCILPTRSTTLVHARQIAHSKSGFDSQTKKPRDFQIAQEERIKYSLFGVAHLLPCLTLVVVAIPMGRSHPGTV